MKKDIQARALAFLQKRNGRPAPQNEIARKLKLKGAQRGILLDCLDEMAEKGTIQELKGFRFRIEPNAPTSNNTQKVKSKRTEQKERKEHGHKTKSQNQSEKTQEGSLVTGIIFVHQRGFGFVTPVDGSEDVFIPQRALASALHGDKIEVRAFPSPKGRDGKVLSIIERRNPILTGRIFKNRRKFWFEPDDPRLPSPMQINGNIPKSCTEKHTVLANVVHWPTDLDPMPEVTIEKELGLDGLTRVEVEKIKIREGIQEQFSQAVTKEGQALPIRVSAKEREGREDLRHLPLLTIDPETARDHDDAVCVQKNKDGSFTVVVAIADVSHYVTEGSAMDQEAFQRGCSVYLPDRAIPMLPHELSTHMASLVAHKERLCLAVEMQIGTRGAIKKYRFVEGIMKSQGHLTYESVARALGLTEKGKLEKKTTKHLPMLSDLHELTRLLRKKRMGRGALHFDLPESKISLDPKTGNPISSSESKGDEGVKTAYTMIEELMLLTNELVAKDLNKRGVPALYRVHNKPDADRISIFAEVANSLGYPIDPESATNPKTLAALLRDLEGKSHAPILHYLLLRSMQQAVYDTENQGHFGLAAKEYLHFTSPIRRYPDLTVHRAVRSIVRKEPIDIDSITAHLKKAGAQASMMERRAMIVERDVKDLYRALLMENRVGETFDATITSIDDKSFYVRIQEPFVDAKIPLQSLRHDFFQKDRLGLRLVGERTGETWALGDSIKISIEEVSIFRREILARPIQEKKKGANQKLPQPSQNEPSARPKKKIQKRNPKKKSTWDKSSQDKSSQRRKRN